ncbi:MAG: hypothetical protein EBS86_13890 [Crocinitomicaceae bacterium]|nr:hypothetical protein [Crocinitomicaceae bacterium]
MIVCLLSVGSYFLFFQNPSEKLLSKKSQTKDSAFDSKKSKTQNPFQNKNDTEKITEIATNKDFETTNSIYTIPSKLKTSVQRSSNTEIVNNTSEAVSISSIIAKKTDAENSNQAFETSIDTNRHQFQFFKFPYLRPILAVSVLTLKTIIVKANENNNCNQRISFQASVNKGINIRTIDGEFNTQSMKSKTIGERRIPTSLTQYQFGMNYHLNEKFAINSGMNFGKSTFQSRWFYRQFFVNTGENAVELRTLNGEASLNDQEIISELSNGDTVLYKIRANYAASFFSIPVGITYHFNKQKLSPFIRYGISLDFHSKSAISLDIQKNGAFKTTDLNFQNNSIRIALQQMVSFGFEYKFSNNWSSFLESRLALPVSKINLSTDYKLKSSYITLGVGVKYALPCNIQKLKK